MRGCVPVICSTVWLMVLALLMAGAPASAAVSDSGRGRHKQLYVVPTPGKVVIDGKLDDWDLSGQIEMFVVEATRSTMNAKVAAMYDAEAFYLSGDISDPTPMMNRHDPKANANRAWNADSFQFRIVVDPAAAYPVMETKFKYTGKSGTEVDKRDDIVHLLLWHYTDAGTAHLQMQVGMGYRVPREEWKPHGLVPADKFQGAYLKRPDGSGYSFEYRIPWETLGAARPLTGGDEVGGTMQVNWSRPDGLATGGGSAWAYDVLREPGFPFQSAACWGRLVFSKTGHVAPELVNAGVPPERPLPLDFAYEVPRDSTVSLQLFNKDNQAVRILVAQQERPAGRNIERWDGLDDQGKLLPAGEYRWRGVYSDPVKALYRFSVHNSGQPPYPTDDNRGGWGADHGYPRAAVALDDGMVLTWNSAEYGWGVIRTDPEGKKLWGAKNSANYVATDGKRLFLAGGPTFHTIPGAHMIELSDSRAAALPNGKATFDPPAGGQPDTNAVTGMVYGGGRLYIAYGGRNLIAVYDAATADVAAAWEVPAPGALAIRPNGAVAVVSGGKVLSVADGKAVPWIETNLDNPTGLAVGPDGAAYVANQGKLQNVSVFGPDGTYRRSIGRAGGRPAVGVYDPSGMYQPGGLALDKQGRLWVAETTDSPKRFSVWNTQTGELAKEFFGGSSYFAYGHIDPDRPDEIYAHNVMWKIDWKAYKAQPLFTIWRKLSPDMAPAPNVDAHSSGGGFRLVSADNGRQYGWGGAGKSRSVLVYLREGERFRPVLGTVDPWRDEYPGLEALKSDLEQKWAAEKGRRPARQLFWQDVNGDGIVQPAEVVHQQGLGQIFSVAKDLTLFLQSGHKLRPIRVEADGRPVYDLAKAEATPLVGNPSFGGFMIAGPDGSVYSLLHRAGPSLVGWSPAGAMLWNYPDLVKWQSSLNLPTVGPGRLWGMTRPMGVADRFLAQQVYFGANQIFRKDGVYVGCILQDGRRSSAIDAYTGQPEGQGGTFVKLALDGKDRYFVIHGGQDVRVWEVLGLDTVQDLAGGVYRHTDEMAAKARKAKEDYEAAVAGARRLTISRGRGALETVEPAAREIEGDRGFKARAAYDDKNLYVRFDVTAAAPLVNGQGEPQILFRGGNCLDIQLAADPKADPNRKTPAPGDLRLLVTRKDKKPFAVLYRPRVAGFTGERIALVSPTGKELFDQISVVNVGLDYVQSKTGFTATVTVPLELLGLELKQGMTLKLDLGYVFGNSQGTRTLVRAYLHNNSFSANVVDDIPNEARLEPAQWGEAVVE